MAVAPQTIEVVQSPVQTSGRNGAGRKRCRLGVLQRCPEDQEAVGYGIGRRGKDSATWMIRIRLATFRYRNLPLQDLLGNQRFLKSIIGRYCEYVPR